MTYVILSQTGGTKISDLNIINNMVEIGSSDEEASSGMVEEVGELRGINIGGALNLNTNTVTIHKNNRARTGAWHLHNFNKINVDDNITINNGNQNQSFRGIYCINSKGSFCDNDVVNFLKGVEISGNCLSEDMFSKTNFGMNGDGLHLQGLTTQLGLQVDKENTWVNPSSYTNNAAYCQANCAQSMFIVDDSNPSFFPDGGIDPPNGWFFPTGTGSNACIPGLAESDIPIANGSYFNGNTSAVIEWDAKRYLFDRLLNNPNLTTLDASLEAFYNTESGTNIESFSIVKNMINDAVKVPSEVSQTLSENNQIISQLLDKIRLLDTQMSTAGNNENIQLLKKSKIDSIDLLYSQINSITDQINSDRNSNFQQILIENYLLTPQTDYEWNEKELNDIILNHWLSGDDNLSEENLNRIRFITGQCPEVGGTVVYQATDYLPECEQLEYKQNPLDCEPQTQQKSNYPTKGSQSSAQNGIELFPNPANNRVTIKFNNVEHSSKTILVNNILGNTLKQIPVLEEGEISIDLSELSSGFYQITGVGNRGKIIWKEKLILNN